LINIKKYDRKVVREEERGEERERAGEEREIKVA
jgi:hypothetical protein